MPATERDETQPRRPLYGVSMRDLLAAGAAAEAVSTPPRAPEPVAPEGVRERKAA
ncbi:MULTISPECIES: hypothetical protein [unclassified Streptomyces]|uniref:hypothetical protein n=1 Tax=unclassified Streptomyces TaxID=2593676 RepID=UPI0016619B67|nr:MULTISPECIES: hypothetical protein [unclassified Streptomyces]MBD0839145.1 hypothetical protein [Streptomyces sp. TRM68416]